MPTSTRPSVSLTVCRRLDNNEVVVAGSDEWKRIRSLLDWHKVGSPHLVSWLCVACGSIGVTDTQENRDNMAKHFDWTCHRDYTVYFRTEEV